MGKNYLHIFFTLNTSLTSIWSIAANGIARRIPVIPKRLAITVIMRSIRNGERSRDLLITMGTRMLFSICCIIMYRTMTAIISVTHIPSAIASAGNRARNGPI